MNNDYVVFSKHLAKKLVKAGFVLKRKVPNKFSPEHKVYYFQNDENIQKIIDKITKSNS